MSLRTLWLSLLLLPACGSPQPEPSAAPVPAATPTAAKPAAPNEVDAAALARAKTTMKQLGTTLKGQLIEKMSSGGPLAALEVCAQDAQSLTKSVAATTGIQVGRSSLKLRNPTNAGPAWVNTWLQTQGKRKAEGLTPEVTTARTPAGGTVVRVVAPLAIEGPCLVCHGPKADRPAELTAAIAAKYPNDKANGYALGDLRGAIWAEAPVVESGLTLELDSGAKWGLDESTRTTIAEIRTAISGPAPADLPAAHALAETLDASVSRMIQGCSMDGASHDQLHHFLEAFFPALSALKASTDPKAANEALWRIQALVVTFDVHFE